MVLSLMNTSWLDIFITLLRAQWIACVQQQENEHLPQQYYIVGIGKNKNHAKYFLILG